MTTVSRRRFLAGTAPAAAVGLAAGVMGTARWPLLARGPADVSDPVRLTDFGITGRQEADVSEKFQAAIDAAASNGGGVVRCPPGVVWAKGLVVPNNITIEGAGIGASTIKLPDGANTDLIQQSGYAQNKTFANLYFGLRDIALDGNKEKNKSGNLVVLRGYRGLVERVRLTRAAGHGVYYSEKSAEGTLNLNGLAENSIRGCFIDECAAAGIYADNEVGNRVSDAFITDCVFNGNGGAGYYQIDLERSAGFHIRGNHMYRGHLGDLRALGAGALIVSANNFDGTDNQPRSGEVRQVEIEAGGWANVIVMGNLFQAHRVSAPDVKRWIQLEVRSKSKSSIAIASNNFNSQMRGGAESIVQFGSAPSQIEVTGNAYGGTSRPPTQRAGTQAPERSRN